MLKGFWWFVAAWMCIIASWGFSYATGNLATTDITPAKIMALSGLACAVIGAIRMVMSARAK